MAIIDTERNVVVVQIVYDGPPHSGKTTSLSTLAKLLGDSAKIYYPPQVAGEKYYCSEWIEYTGGFFKGYRISCQIIGIHGQISLDDPAHHYLLQSADAVVWMMDASVAPEICLNNVRQLNPILLHSGENTVKAIIQANKQDQPKATSAAQLKKIFQDYPHLKIVDSVATHGKGVRETFVLAVRLAIERADVLLSKGKIPYGKSIINNIEELRNKLQEIHSAAVQRQGEQSSHAGAWEQEETAEKTVVSFEEPKQTREILENSASVVKDSVTVVTDKEIVISNDSYPIIPQVEPSIKTLHPSTKVLPIFFDKNTTIRWVWPPFRGRHIINEVLQYPLEVCFENDQWWNIYAQKEWRCFSKKAWQYTRADQVQIAFRSQLGTHLSCSPILSEQRCLAVAQDDAHQSWRLWQITPCLPTLGELLIKTLQQDTPAQQALETFRCIIRYVDMVQQSNQYLTTLSVDLENVGVDRQGREIYLGPVEKSTTKRTQTLDALTLTPLIQQEFTNAITKLLPLIKPDTPKIIAELRNIDGFEQQYLLELLIELFSNV